MTTYESAHDEVLAALADPTRRAVLEALRGGPRSVSDLAADLPVSRPAVSQHLRALADAGLVVATPAGTRRLYRLVPEGLGPVRRWAATLWDIALQEYTVMADQLAQDLDLPPVVHEVEVPLTPRQAFDLYTDGMARWWPLDSHSVGRDRARTVTCPAEVDAPITEELEDGSTAVWGTVTRVVVPDGGRGLIIHTWHPGRGPETAQQVTVTFTAGGRGTLVRLEHTGWHLLGDGAADMRAGYVTGWALVLGRRFVAAAVGDDVRHDR